MCKRDKNTEVIDFKLDLADIVIDLDSLDHSLSV